MDTTPDTERDPGAVPVEIDDAAKAAISRLRRVVVPTDEKDPALARARGVALRLATEHGFDVVLYDRSDERWTDTPHPTGPLVVDDVDDDKRPHLVRQMRDFEAAGVTTTAWLATVPTLTAMLDVLQEMDIDGVLLPEELDKPKLMDRIMGGSDVAAMIERLTELQLPTPPIVLVIPESGAISLITTEENTA